MSMSSVCFMSLEITEASACLDQCYLLSLAWTLLSVSGRISRPRPSFTRQLMTSHSVIRVICVWCVLDALIRRKLPVGGDAPDADTPDAYYPYPAHTLPVLVDERNS